MRRRRKLQPSGTLKAILRLLLLGTALSAWVHAAAEADLLVAYDNGYSDGVGGDDNAEVLAANAIAASNAINDRSGTGARMRIAGFHKTWYQAARSTLGGYINWMTNYGDGELDDVTTAGDARGADLVMFVCAPNAGETAAGVAQQPGRYSALSPGSFWANIVAHETGGHNYGCDHRDGGENPKTIMLHNYCGGGSQGYFSNPNIWLNGTKLLGQGSCLGGTAGAGGDNAYLISSAAQSVADRKSRVVVAPNLGNVVRRWRFDAPAGGIANGTTVTDSVTGTALTTVLGNGANYTGKALRLPGGAGGSGAAYLQLPGGVVSSNSDITIEIWATPLSPQNWARILDFNDGTTANYITLSSSIAGDLNAQRLESKVGGNTVNLDSGLPSVAGVPHHYTLTFDGNGGGGRWQWYRDGDPVAFLDVAYPLSALPDTNNWLGRSIYVGDNYANCDYAEVRISNVAMNRDEVRANFLLGSNHDDSMVTMNGGDAIGGTSFNQPGQWSGTTAPSAANSYESFGFDLRTPPDAVSRTFSGNALSLSGGRLLFKATGNSSTTINNLTLKGNADLVHAGSGTWTLAGNLSAESGVSQVRAANGPINLNANLGGDGSLLFLNNTVTLGGTNNTYSGKTLVGDGRFSGLSINSEARLGSNPAAFTADQLTLNRGTLFSTSTMTLDDTNRGIRIGVSAGIFNVAAGTTLTLAVAVSGEASGNQLQTTPFFPNPVSGMFIKDNSGILNLTHPNHSHNGEILINSGGLTVFGAGRLNNGEHTLPITNNGILTIGSTADQILSGPITGGGSLVKANSGKLTLSGANTFTGPVSISGGRLEVMSSTGTGTVTVANGGTLSGSGSTGGSLTIQSGGTFSPGTGIATLTINGNATLQAGSITALEIRKSPLANDFLTMTGTLNLGGTLRVANLSGSLAYGDSFDLFDATSTIGNFSSYSLPALGAGLVWDTSAIQNGVITVGTTVPSAPATPAGLMATGVNQTQIHLDWSPSFGAATYIVRRATSSGGPYTTIATGLSETSFSNSGLPSGTTCYYVVSAVNAIGESANSAPAAATAPDTMAHWNFEEGTLNSLVPGPAANGSYSGGMLDVSGKGNHLSPWSGSTYYYRANTPAVTTTQTGIANGRSIQNAGSYPSATTVGTSLNTWSPPRWTIEAAIRPDNVSGVKTIVGRDSLNHAGTGSPAALYFSLRGSVLGIQFTDTAGNIWNLESATNAVVAGNWQAVAASSDGSTLSLYLKNITAGNPDYTLLGTLDISASANPSLAVGAGDGGDWNAGEFSIGRGIWAGGHADRFIGFLDDIRITKGALGKRGFLYSAPLNFPAAPSAPDANAVSTSQIDLTWSASGGAAGYYVKRSTQFGGPYTTIANPTGTSFSDTGLSPATVYHYVVSAINAIGEGPESGGASATVLTPSQAWRNRHFSTTADTGDAADDADPDHDDVMNLLERAFGGNPNEPDRTIFPHTDDTAPLLSIIYQKSITATDLSFVVQESTNLTTPIWEIASGNSVLVEDNGTIQRIRFTAPVGGAERKFLRVKVTGP